MIVPSPDISTAPAPAVPDWFTPGDPHLSSRMRQVAEIAAAERELGTAIEEALALYLTAAHARLLDQLPATIQAAVGTPDLADWPERERGWLAAVQRFVYAVLAALFSRRFRAELRALKVQAAVDAFLAEYLNDVWQRLRLFSEIVYNEVRAEISTSVAAGESAAQTRERVSQLLRIDAPSRSLVNQMLALQRTIDDPATREPIRRQARARLTALRRRTDRASRRWWPKVAELARTLAISVLNAATAESTEAYTQITGTRRYMQWWAVRDDRTRPAHRAANGQTRRVGESFSVGGFPMRYPGDPLAPPDLTTNCRCSLLSLSQAQEQRLSRDPRRVITAASNGGKAAMNAPVLEPPETTGAPPVLAAGTSLPSELTTVRWSGVLAPLGVPSGDRRMLASVAGKPDHRELPLPLLYQAASAPGHDNSVVVGSIDRVWTQDGNLMGEGRFDLGDDTARDVVRKIAEGFARWVSVAIDKETVEMAYFRDGQQLSAAQVAMYEDFEGVETVQVCSAWRLMSATIVAEPAFQEATIGLLDDVDLDEDDDLDDEVIVQRRRKVVTAGADTLGGEADEDGEPTPAPAEPVEITVSTEYAPTAKERKAAESSGAAMPGGRYPIRNEADLRKAIRAVGRAGGPDGSEEDRDEVRRHIIKRAKALGLEKLIPFYWGKDGSLRRPTKSSLLAAGDRQSWYEQVATVVPQEPPATWFTNPQLTGPTKIRVTEEGRVYGHIAAWNTKHAALPGDIVPPHDPNTAYNKFHRHPVRTAEGTRVKTGPLAGHGHYTDDKGNPRRASVWEVQRHYDNPDYVLADVVVGEDAHGIWCSGSLRYGVSAYQVMFADRYSFSGDWRGGELLAACLASVPGFHLDADDTVEALAASAGLPEPLSLADVTPRMLIEDGEVVALVAAGALPTEREVSTTPVAITVGFDSDPEEWGREIGRGMFAGLREAGVEAAAQAAYEQEQVAMAARIAEFRKRINAPREAEVARLRARLERVGLRVSA